MFDPNQITFFAKTDARGKEVPFGIKAIDRTKHMYVIGKTGMGKSTLLENMAVQDIKNGNGLAFIDPHGATAETLLNYIPEERVKDVLYFAPFDTSNPISFNVMEDVGPDRRHLVVSGLMSVFKKIWVDAWSARMEYILSNTLLALLEYPDSTLLGVNRMLSDKHYRKAVINNITDPAVKSFWVDEFLNYNERYMQEAGDAIKNKIGQFTSNPLIRNIIGQPKSSFDLREVMDGKKILIANLSKGLVGEQNANLLGSMLTTRIYLAAMSRADLSSEQIKQAPNFYFYVDEFQSFANATFADILSEARKYKLNLTIAHQYIEQMEEEVRNAVFGNVGTIISFRVGPFDAEILETVFTPKFLAADIVNLGFAQIYLTLMIDGIGSHPFSAVTLPPIETQRVSFKDMVIAASRKQFGHERAEVEEKINDWHHQIFDEKKLAYEEQKAERIARGELPPEAAGKHTPVKQAVAKQGGGQMNRETPRSRGSSAPASQSSKSSHQPERERTQAGRHTSDRRGGDTKQAGDRSRGKVSNQQKTDKRPAEKRDKPVAPKEKSVDELRAVLRTMVEKNGEKSADAATTSPAAAGTASAKTRTPKSKEEQSRENQAAKRGELKSVVATIAQHTTHAPEKVPEKGNVKPVRAEQSTTARDQKTSQSNNRSASAHTKKEARKDQAIPNPTSSVAPVDRAARYNEQKHDNPFDRKKLERMLKNSGQDRHPLH